MMSNPVPERKQARMSQKSCIAFTGGGTSGHIFPGLTVIDSLRERWSGRIIWIGSGGQGERRLFQKRHIIYYAIPAGKWRRYLSMKNLFDIFRIVSGFLKACVILIRERPRLVFSKGGYVSVPGVLAARVLGIPVFTHESDFNPGFATRINSLVAERILTSFHETEAFISPKRRPRVLFTGNPVRKDILRGDVLEGRRLVGCPDGKPLVLVLGGSQGSASINRMVAGCIRELVDRCCVLHQMGREHFQPSELKGYTTAPFLNEELPDVLAAADLVVCRAGAGTLSELSVLGKPAVLIPLPLSSSRGDQIRNSRFYTEKGAAETIPDEQATGERLLEIVTDLLNNVDRRNEMGKRMKSLGVPGSALHIAGLIREKLKA